MPDKVIPQKPGESTAAYGTRLTALALQNSPAAGVALDFAGVNTPNFDDVENRLHNPSTTVPAPSLMQRLQAQWQLFQQKAHLALLAAQGKDPYAQPAIDPNFYIPGQDASSAPPLTAQQAALIRSQAGQRFR